MPQSEARLSDVNYLKWKAAHGFKFSVDDDRLRYLYYLETEALIKDAARKSAHASFEHNQFSALTEEERDRRRGLPPANGTSSASGSSSPQQSSPGLRSAEQPVEPRSSRPRRHLLQNASIDWTSESSFLCVMAASLMAAPRTNLCHCFSVVWHRRIHDAGERSRGLRLLLRLLTSGRPGRNDDHHELPTLQRNCCAPF